MTKTTNRNGTSKGKGRGEGREERLGDVIHVAFGEGGGRIPPGAVTQDGGGPPILDAAVPEPPGREPVTELFTKAEVAKLLGVPRRACARSTERHRLARRARRGESARTPSRTSSRSAPRASSSPTT